MSRAKKYIAIFYIAAVQSIKNYKSLIGLSIFLITCMLIFSHLWQVAPLKKKITFLRPDLLLWYIAFNEWILVSLPEIHLDMEQDLRTGRLAYLLPRPVSYLYAIFCEAIGILCVNLVVLGCVTFTFAWIKLGYLPFSGTLLVSGIIIGFFAGIVGIIFHMLIGISAFWFHDVSPFGWVWEKLLFLLGGLMIPLTVYPRWIQIIANCTPFPVLLGDRSGLIFSGSWWGIFFVTLKLCGWGFIGFFVLRILYQKGLCILNIQGG